MQMPTFLAFLRKRPLHAAALQQKLRILEEFYELSPHDRMQLYDECGGLFCWDVGHSLVDVPLRRLEEGRRLTLSAHLPYGVSSVVSQDDLLSGRYIDAVLDRAVREGEILSRINPPMAMLRYDANSQVISILNDAIGFARIYEFRRQGWWIWTNRLAMAPIFSGIAPESDDDGWATLAAAGWFLGEKTAYRHARVLPPATFVSADAGRIDVSHRTLYSIGVNLGSVRSPTEEDIDRVYDDVTSVFSETGAFSQAPLSLGLSGGRDSRMIASLALAKRRDIRVHTAFPPMLELEIAESLIRRAPFPIDWHKVDRRDIIGRGSIEGRVSLVEVGRTWARYCDGDMMPSRLSLLNTPNLKAPSLGKFSVSGVAGELAHANFYTQKHIGNDASERIRAYSDALFQKAPFLRKDRVHVGKDIFSDTMTEARSHGITSFHQLDYWYLLSRMRRWAGGNWSLSTVLPLTAPTFLSVGFRQPVSDKLSSALHRRLIDRAAPFWSEVPFFHERKEEVPVRERTTGGAMPALWESGHLSELLALLRSHPELWTIYDRSMINAFEKILDTPQTHVRMQNVAHRVLWRIGFTLHLQDVSSAAANSSVAEHGRLMAMVRRVGRR